MGFRIQGILYTILIFLILLAVTTLIHEYTHYMSGKILGLNPSGPFWSDLKYLAPSVRCDVDQWSWQLTVTHYVGGLFAGGAMLVVYLFLNSKDCFRRSK